MKQDIAKRVESLRNFMKTHQLDAFIIPGNDPHTSEYPPEHWKGREWVSGFDGSAGTAVVTRDKAALWTDSRYFIAAAQQLEDTPFELMKDGITGTPSIGRWLADLLQKGSRVGLEGEVNTHSFVEDLRKEAGDGGMIVVSDVNPLNEIWSDRPALPKEKVIVHPIEYAGKSCHEKLEELRALMESNKAETILVAALDDVAWLLNLRGNDVRYNPVFVGYVLVSSEYARLYVDKTKISNEVEVYLKNEGVVLRPYSDICTDIMGLSTTNIVLPANVNEAIYGAASRLRPKLLPSVIASMKSVKNETEIEGFRNAMTRDGVAMVKFLRWLKPAVEAGGETEISIARKLSAFRAEHPLYCGDSFDTVSAYQAHAAIVHYGPTADTDVHLKPEGVLLLDSGGQYKDGTTDITRTICLGYPTDKQKHDFTLVLKGHINLSKCKFPEGVSGTQIDVCARYAMWQEGMNFGHGTGHGVGSHLCVHEGPHQIRMNYMPAPIKAGMIVTDEPGLYIEGEYGIRIENTLLVVPFKETRFGVFVGFEPLTLCPIDTSLIERSMLSVDEVAWINDYHFTVRTKLIPMLDADERKWIEEVTRPIL